MRESSHFTQAAQDPAFKVAAEAKHQSTLSPPKNVKHFLPKQRLAGLDKIYHWACQEIRGTPGMSLGNGKQHLRANTRNRLDHRNQ